MGKTERIALRASAGERALLSEASRVRKSTLSEFVLGAALAEAVNVLADRTQFTVPPEQWDGFVELLDRPPVHKPRLRRVLTKPSAIDE
jgi:uncharacterized protein (DUF1778 family)